MDVNINIGKVWIAIDRLTTIWKPDLSDKIEWVFFQADSHVSIIV